MSFENSRVLVTGGAGFIGDYLVRRLLSLGAAVTVVDDPSANPSVVPDRVTMFKLRLPNPQLAKIVGQGEFDAIFHLAGASYVPPSVDDPFSDLRNNAEVTLQVLEAVRNFSPTTRLVYTSSAAVYGNPEKLPISENHPLVPVSPYGVSKLAAESYVSLYARLHSLRTASLRLFSVYGPGQHKQVVFDLVAKLNVNPKELEVYGTGYEIRDFIYVDDVVSAAILVITQGDLRGEEYNVASGEGTSIHELVETILSVMEMRPQIHYTGHVRPGDALRWIADISRLSSVGFTPSVSLHEGTKRVVNWYIHQWSHGLQG